MKQFLLATVLFSFIGTGFAQEGTKGWLMYFGQTNFKDSKFSIHHEFQYRNHDLINTHNQSLLRIGLKYSVSESFNGVLGYGAILTDEELINDNSFWENRIYQEGTFSHRLRKTKVRHRLRFEERFIEDKDFRGRFRYSLAFDVPISGSLYAAAYDEIFLNISDDDNLSTYDRNRAYLGLGYKLKPAIGLQLGYMRQHVGRKSGTNHAMLSLHHQILWAK